MATYYVATGVSGGDGSTGSPWNWDEMTAQLSSLASGDEVVIRAGTHAATLTTSIASSDVWFHGDTNGSRPVVSFGGSFTGKCVAVTATEVKVGFLEFDAPNASHTVDFDVAFRGWAWDLKGGFFDVRAGRGSGYGRLEASQIQASGSSVSASTSGIVTNDGSWPMGLDTSIIGKVNASNAVAATIIGCVVYGSGSSGGISVADCYLRNCVVINATTGIDSSGVVAADGCLFFNNTSNTSGNVIERDSVQMDADPFVDSDNADFRLTSAAKASAWGDQLKAIMAGIVGVPGVTTDSLSDLIGGGGGNIIVIED